jgi:hypothetical protein
LLQLSKVLKKIGGHPYLVSESVPLNNIWITCLSGYFVTT